jgi:Peptidase family M23
MGTGLNYLALLMVALLASCTSITGVQKSSDPCKGNTLTAELRSTTRIPGHDRRSKSEDFSGQTELCSWTKGVAACKSLSQIKESVCNLINILDGKKSPVVPDLKFPVRGGCLSSPFGFRHGVFHSGLDIAAAKGDPITACADGRVVCAGSRKGYRSYGLAVLIDHGHNVCTHYAHMSRILVRKGQKVVAGQTIGLVGSTGRSTSPHLHLEVKVGSQFYNPLAYFPSSELKRIQVAKDFPEPPMGPVRSQRGFSLHH